VRVLLNSIKELVITAGYGDLNTVHTTPHTGIDVKFSTGEQILSPVSGVVSRIVDYGSENIGRGIMIKVDGSRELIFGHLSKIYLHTGDKVTFGMPIGEAGSTGHSTGSHLHLGLKVNGTFANPSHYFDLLQTAYQQNFHHINQYATDVVTNKSHLYNAVSGLIQAFSN
jgi:murein DD-endopeptidase MepM/ murein hydrolase activator NlpD